MGPRHMAEKARQLHQLASVASDAQRSLETAIARGDSAWNDTVRRGFEADHLAGIRADARHLRVELEEIAQVAERALRQLRLNG
jgi:hypothetical protein